MDGWINDDDDDDDAGAGQLCEEQVDGCQSSPCVNNGTCISSTLTSSSYTCACPLGYTGQHCSQRNHSSYHVLGLCQVNKVTSEWRPGLDGN